jgi:hypothetical protein
MDDDVHDPLSDLYEMYDQRIQSGEIAVRLQAPSVLYHYTNVEGLHGIVGSRTLRASSAYFLNDSSEIEYGCGIVVEALMEWGDANRGSVAPAMKVLGSLKENILSDAAQFVRMATIYVSCFCEGGNLLSQWRAYGQSGGYAIGMFYRGITQLKAVGVLDTRLVKVEYKPRVQRKKIHSILREFVERFEGTPYLASAIGDPTLFKDTLIFLREVLLEEIVAFKNPAFCEEREWRLVAKPRLVDLRRSIKPAAEPTQRKFKTNNSVIVPFVDVVPPAEELLPIESVRFGPSLNKFRAKSSLNYFLSHHCYDDVEVLGSDTPVILG